MSSFENAWNDSILLKCSVHCDLGDNELFNAIQSHLIQYIYIYNQCFYKRVYFDFWSQKIIVHFFKCFQDNLVAQIQKCWQPYDLFEYTNKPDMSIGGGNTQWKWRRWCTDLEKRDLHYVFKLENSYFCNLASVSINLPDRIKYWCLLYLRLFSHHQAMFRMYSVSTYSIMRYSDFIRISVRSQYKGSSTWVVYNMVAFGTPHSTSIRVIAWGLF